LYLHKHNRRRGRGNVEDAGCIGVFQGAVWRVNMGFIITQATQSNCELNDLSVLP
jgi:hypothetical protein